MHGVGDCTRLDPGQALRAMAGDGIHCGKKQNAARLRYVC